jgi:hypothetical protein
MINGIYLKPIATLHFPGDSQANLLLKIVCRRTVLVGTTRGPDPDYLGADR